jgi:F-type H+-transporting ATPase subunit delta
MISSAVVNRYANALADVVVSVNSDVQPPQAIEQLRGFDDAVQSASDLRRVMASPSVSAARKRAVIRRIADSLSLSRVVRNFLLVLGDHRRLAALTQVIDAFEALLDERLGFKRAEVRSALELADHQRDELSNQLAKLAGSQVRIGFTLDPDLIGGVTARIGSTVYDGSVRGRLNAMRQRLIGIARP